ncbi:serine/threonine-protein kinase [Phycicoccus flavus]|uniref:non-specific serine/threonine protein kinase n=1 Tax=Phycicoccus flavus TaxID=2502783 RepID=A0A8T6R5N7_9MICO|nr:serine/threonine-protein kinase [Phycicoccus flavus]NHA68893.1 protein kinase [Phycicoccus flavus]
MSTCTQPGCTGSVVDGYCDVCGMAATPASGSPAPAASAAPSADGSACAVPGCSGHLLDGWCDVCGTPAGDAAAASAPAASPAGGAGETPAGVDSAASVATSSSRLDSAAIGSRRAASGSTVTTRTRTGSTRTRAARLGAGLTSVPPAAAVDAARAVLTDPQVPENKRSCASCGGPVGRSQGDRPGRPEGFCPACGAPYSFTPKLTPGELVANQYLVAGALAHGGLGWIYLARDRNVSDRWVVLKGLLNSGDPDALAAAIAEQRFLAQVEHPLIVEIFNFVTHEDAGYIVMEFVGGRSLKQLLKERMRAAGGAYDPLPVDQALAFVVEVLPAFQYLHDLGLAYCDFKPDNLVQVGDAVKLIDLGGVRRIDDDDSAIYGTVGYQAPEVPQVGTSVASDLYTVGRTLVVLVLEFTGYQGRHLHSLPDPVTTPVFRDNDSLYWLVAKACAPDPADRFVSADEMRGQALGVLREVVARGSDGTTLTSASSEYFATPAVATSRLDWDQLPDLRPDTADPQLAWLLSLAPGEPEERLRELAAAPEDTAEVWLARARESLRAGDATGVSAATSSLLQADPWDWRALWVGGLSALAAGRWDDAQAAFNAVYRQVPGELAPKLALALACERGGRLDLAETLYGTCAATDAAYVAPAAFGMARVRAARGDSRGAVTALDLVPSTSRGFVESRRLRAEVLIDTPTAGLAALDDAMRSIESVRMLDAERNLLSARILERALEAVTSGGGSPTGTVGSHAATESSLRTAVEGHLRALARDEPDAGRRVELVDRANAVRDWSLT